MQEFGTLGLIETRINDLKVKYFYNTFARNYLNNNTEKIFA